MEPFNKLLSLLYNNVDSPFGKKIHQSTRAVKSLKAKKNARRTLAEFIADIMTESFGSIMFLAINILWFAFWIVVNINIIPGIVPFDPFPFGLLTMIVSLEAIILAIFVLISQNREQKVNDLREEIDLQIGIITEAELTKIMEIVVKIAEKNSIDLSNDKELKDMLKKLNTNKVESSLEKEIL